MSAGKDSSVRLWDVQHGTELFRWDTKHPARACAFANIDQRLVLFATDPFSTVPATLRLARLADLPEDTPQEPQLQIELERSQKYASYPPSGILCEHAGCVSSLHVTSQ